jgi:DNA-binding Lrp family transcriptional regulator
VSKIYKFDAQEIEIVKRLVRNPRISDNQIAKATKVPVKTVNRKRKLLEEKGYLNYMAYVDYAATQIYPAKKIYVIILKNGITRHQLVEKLRHMEHKEVFTRHIVYSYAGEVEGHVALFAMLESFKEDDLAEILNNDVVAQMRAFFGPDAVVDTRSVSVFSPIRLMHNYLPMQNLKNGIIKPEWPDSSIFVG